MQAVMAAATGIQRSRRSACASGSRVTVKDYEFEVLVITFCLLRLVQLFSANALTFEHLSVFTWPEACSSRRSMAYATCILLQATPYDM